MVTRFDRRHPYLVIVIRVLVTAWLLALTGILIAYGYRAVAILTFVFAVVHSLWAYRVYRTAHVPTHTTTGSTVRSSTMSATLKLTHKAIGVEVRRGTYDIEVDGAWVGSVQMNDTTEIPIEPGQHTLRIRSGRNSSRTTTFDAAEGEVAAFRCTGKNLLPVFLASFFVPSLALTLVRV